MPRFGDPVIHELKTWPPYFQYVLDGDKTWEIRKADRDFRAGDILRLREYIKTEDRYTGRDVSVEVIMVVSGLSWGLEKSFVVMSIRLTSAERDRLADEVEDLRRTAENAGFDEYERGKDVGAAERDRLAARIAELEAEKGEEYRRGVRDMAARVRARVEAKKMAVEAGIEPAVVEAFTQLTDRAEAAEARVRELERELTENLNIGYQAGYSEGINTGKAERDGLAARVAETEAANEKLGEQIAIIAGTLAAIADAKDDASPAKIRVLLEDMIVRLNLAKNFLAATGKAGE